VLKDYYRYLPILLSLIPVQPVVSAESNDINPASTHTEKDHTDKSVNSQSSNIVLAAAIGAAAIDKKPIVNRISPEIIFDDEKNLRLLELHIGKYNLKELIAAYQHRDMIMIPIGFLSELIDLAIKVDRENNSAEGFIFHEQNTFNLDVGRSEVTLNGKLSRFDPDRVAVRELDDIYIDSRLLSEWLSVKINIDLLQSQLKIISDQPLPFEKRKLREEQIKHARSRLKKQDLGYPLHDDPPEKWAYPLIDQTIRLGFIRDREGDYEGTFAYSTFATADLFKMESSWYLTGTEDDLLDDARVVFSKKDPNAGLFGAAKATEFSFGHITESSFDHVTRSTGAQPGIVVSSYPLKRQLEYDRHQFIGDLLPGWEVELYRNNALLDYQVAGSDGQYRFDDVPLLFGSNHFRLVFYGPQGQQREETYTFNLDSSLTEPGAYYYRASVMEDEESGNRVVINSDLGIHQNISASFGFASIPVADVLAVNPSHEQHNYLKAGIRGFKDQFFYRADYTKDMQSGGNLDWNVQTRLGSSLLRFGEIYFQNDFESELFPTSLQSIERRTNLKFDTYIPSKTFNNIPVSFEYNRDSYSNNIITQQFLNRFSLSAYGYAFSNTLFINKLTDSEDAMNDTMQLSSRKMGINTRGVLNYIFKPESELATISVTVDGFKFWNYFITIGVNRAFQSETDTLTYSMLKSHGRYTLGASASYSTGGVIAANLTLSAGIGREPRTGKWKSEYRPYASNGSISSQVYLDENGNGTKDPDEKGLKDISLRVNGTRLPQKTDAQGIAYLTGMETYRALDIDISVESLEDPLWNPAVTGKRLLLRPGHTTLLDFPIEMTGEIDGTITAELKNREQAVSGVIVELLNLDGKVIRKTKSEYDGFYLFSKIPLDTYTIQISPSQVKELHLEPVEPEIIRLDKGNQIINGVNIKLKRLSSTETRHKDIKSNGADTKIQTQNP